MLYLIFSSSEAIIMSFSREKDVRDFCAIRRACGTLLFFLEVESPEHATRILGLD